MAMRLRLRRLFVGKSRFSKAEYTVVAIEDVPEAGEVSSTSSGIASHDDESFNGSDGSTSEDPYADVRARMELLSARDKARYAAHTEDHKHVGHTVSRFIVYASYFAYAVLFAFGYIHELASWFSRSDENDGERLPSSDTKLYAPLLQSWDHFFTRRIYKRIQDCFNRPIASNPGAHIDVVERVSDDNQSTMKVLGSLDNLDNERQRDLYRDSAHFKILKDGTVARRCLNMGSYNYLGFADDWHETCGDDVMDALENFPVSASSSLCEYGTTVLHRQVEKTVASFLGKEDAICLNMGFNTNATTIPALMGRGDLLISDELNHTSIVNGARASGAAIRIFRHNDMEHLEAIVREAIILGRPRTRLPWIKILVIVEGTYSMEGEYCDLRNVVRICKKYGAYVYLDEAHSIGAMGATGRGCSEYTGVKTSDIDIMMGTFTKSFGAMGGYIAGSKETISFLRQRCAGSAHHNALSPIVCQQIISSFKVIMGEDGTNIGRHKLTALRDNSNYFRMRLQEMGLQVLGQFDSPVVPIMLYNPTKIGAFGRECLKRGIAAVVVGCPAVPLLYPRARFCLSAGHSRHDLDRALDEIEKIADILGLRYNKATCEKD